MAIRGAMYADGARRLGASLVSPYGGRCLFPRYAGPEPSRPGLYPKPCHHAQPCKSLLEVAFCEGLPPQFRFPGE